MAVILQNRLFHHSTLWIPRTHLSTLLKDFCLDIISHSLPTSWTFHMQWYHANNFGEWISAHRYSFHTYQKSNNTGLSPHNSSQLWHIPDNSMDYLQCLGIYLTHHPHSKVLLLNELLLYSAGCKYHNPCIPRILAVLYPSLAIKLNQISTSNMILDPMFFAKEPCPCHQRSNILGWRFGVPA